MLRPDPKDFSVDLTTRRVRHSSGAAVVFHTYASERDWHRSASARIENGDLFLGLQDELAIGAKRAAIAAGMKRC